MATGCRISTENNREVIGQFLHNIKGYILNENRLVPVGVTGELFIGGAGVARGYLNNDELTRERFIQNPFSDDPNDRLYKTGDLGRWLPDGNIEFIGRADDQVKIRGFRVEPGEVESQLSKHSLVRSCVVIAREEIPGDKRLVAYVLLDAGVESDDLDLAGELRGYLQTKLPEYMIPSAYVELANIPLTVNGKVDRKALPAPDVGAYTQDQYVAPKDETERVLVEIWSELLGLEAEAISTTSNFFALGGHSILLTSLIAHIEKRFHKKIKIVDLLEKSTISGLTELINEAHIDTETKEKNIIQLKSGWQQPIFLIHEVTGLFEPYISLSRAIGQESPVYCLHLEEEDREFLDMYSLESLAERYMNIIRKVQSCGPYRLAGWSLGGLIAYEIASQLLRDNKDVEFLGLIDTVRTDTRKMKKSNQNSIFKTEIDEVAMSILMDYIERQNTDELILREMNEIQELESIFQISQSRGILPIESTLEEIRKRAKTSLDLAIMAAKYKPQYIPTTVHLFRASSSSYELPYLGWSTLMHKKWHIVDVEGDHSSVMKVPFVTELGKKMTAVLKNEST